MQTNRTPITSGSREEQCAADLAKELYIPALVARLLVQRGITTVDAAKAFLYPELSALPSPFLMKGMAEAVDLVVSAMEGNWQVVVYGDYDVDGISATSLLTQFFELLDLQVKYYLPSRLREGYGVNEQALIDLRKQYPSQCLLVTVDCGISANREIALARSLGFKTLVTDHHEPPDDLPSADAIINPKQEDCAFPFAELSGVGVAFYLIMGLRKKLVEAGLWAKNSAPNLKQYLDLVALGTIADVMPLIGLNRILVRAGLEVLSTRRRPGIWALCQFSGLEEGMISSQDLSYRLAPRLNAAGRLGTPDVAVDLLCARKTSDALTLAKILDQTNMERRRLEEEAKNQALDLCREQVNAGRKALVVYNSTWHPGVVGIIASRIVDQFNLPAIVFTDNSCNEKVNQKKLIKGSGRSVFNLNLHEVLKQCTTDIDQFGGHAMAVGLTVTMDNFDRFSDKINSIVSGITLSDKDAIPNRAYILEQGDRVFDQEFFRAYQLMEPFGESNPEPVFLQKDQKIMSAKIIQNHLKFSLDVEGREIHGIGFNLSDHYSLTHNPIDLSFTLKRNTFRGVERLEAHAVHLSASGT